MNACCKESATNKAQLLTESIGWNVDPEWSPDGKQIAFTYVSFRRRCDYGFCSDTRRTTDVYIMDADGSGEARLTPLDSNNEHPEHSPAWSPSGDQIAYVRGSATSSAIYIMDVDGSDPTLVRMFPDTLVADLDWR
jgi:Tol biopolymer transport system component